MSENHKLKSCLTNFLSSLTFKDRVYGEIFHGFSAKYPEYSCGYAYQQVYRIIRYLVDCDLIVMKRTRHHYKYSSNYSVDELNFRLLHETLDDELKDKISDEFKEVSMDIEKLRLEIVLFERYMNKYPNLKDRILDFKLKSERQLIYLESQSCVLNTIRESFV